jgi:CxxC motif-containing protein
MMPKKIKVKTETNRITKRVLHTGDEYKLVDKFYHKGLLCAIIKIDRSTKLPVKLKNKFPLPYGLHYHCGYVELKHDFKYEDLADFIKCAELTFSGNLPFFSKKIKFVGFDTAHYWNLIDPKTQELPFAKKKIIQLAKEMSKINWEKVTASIVAEKI